MTDTGETSVPRVAVAGMGYWGKNLVRNFAELGALALVCDNDANREDVVTAAYPGVDFVTRYETVLERDDIDAVVLATPAVMHFEMAYAAISAGKDVYVEKPLSLSVEHGATLVRHAAQNQRILMVGHILQYHPAVKRLKALITEGVLGHIQYVYSNRLNIGKVRTEENILWSFAPHDISVILGLLDEEPCEVACAGGAYLSQDIPDVTMSQFLFPSGVRAHIHVSWLHPFKEQRLVIIGSDSMAVFDDTAEDKLVLYPHRVEWENHIPTAIKADAEAVPLPEEEPLKNECSHFLDCILSREQPLTDGLEGLRVLSVLSACEHKLQSARSGTISEPAAESKEYFAHHTASIDEGCQIGAGSKIWHYSHLMKNARIGKTCNIGQNVYIDQGVTVGERCKIQNNVSIYAGTTLEDDVFLGPSCVLTNVTNPRSQVNRHSLYEETTIKRGATVGANATIVCGVTLGRYSFVGAGAVVTRDIHDYELVIGNPAQSAGWMSRHGHRLDGPDCEGIMVCPESGFRYKEAPEGGLTCLDLDEESPLPEHLQIGERSYDDFKTEL